MRDRPAILVDRALVVSRAVQRDGQIHRRRVVVGLQALGRLQRGCGILPSTQLRLRASQVELHLPLLGCDPRRMFEQREGLRRIVQFGAEPSPCCRAPPRCRDRRGALPKRPPARPGRFRRSPAALLLQQGARLNRADHRGPGVRDRRCSAPGLQRIRTRDAIHDRFRPRDPEPAHQPRERRARRRARRTSSRATPRASWT